MLKKIPFIKTILKKRRQRKEELWFLTHSTCRECEQALGYIPDASAPFCKACGEKIFIDAETWKKREAEQAEQTCVWCGLREEDTGFLHSVYLFKSGIKKGLCDRCLVAFCLEIFGFHLDDELLKDALAIAYDHIVNEQRKKHAAVKAQKSGDL